MKPSTYQPTLENYHQARWCEPLLFEISEPGQRGVIPLPLEDGIREQVKDPLSGIPDSLRRPVPPALPELSQVHVLRHFLRLSQETLGAGLAADMGMATSTVKYNPPVNEQIVRSPKLTELHSLQDEDTAQGVLEIMYRFEQMLKAVSGMSRFTLQPRGGSAAIYTNALILRAWHLHRGEPQRDEIITTIFSHPSNAACPASAGFKVVTLYPEADGYPSVDALRAALSERTAGLFITNPDDTGIFNAKIGEFVRLVHEAGGLCVYDQANANGLLGIVRAADVGFDMCHFNLHKTFGTPHASGGPGAGASGVSEALAPFLPVPTVEFDGEKYHLDYNRPLSIGKVASFYGVVPNVVRAYAWVMSLGAEGLRKVAETAVLNNNYFLAKMRALEGITAPFAEGKHRLEQVRYSLEKLAKETGLHSSDLARRAADFGIHFFLSHHPFVVPEPATVEPTESYSQADLDYHAAVFARLIEEAYTRPEVIRTAPHRAAIHQMPDPEYLENPQKWAITWRAYRRKAALPRAEDEAPRGESPQSAPNLRSPASDADAAGPRAVPP